MLHPCVIVFSPLYIRSFSGAALLVLVWNPWSQTLPAGLRPPSWRGALSPDIRAFFDLDLAQRVPAML